MGEKKDGPTKHTKIKPPQLSLISYFRLFRVFRGPIFLLSQTRPTEFNVLAMAHSYYPIDENPAQSLRACAFYLAQDIAEPSARTETLEHIVQHYLAAGDLTQAAQALEPLYDVRDNYQREQCFVHLAGYAAAHGHDDFAWAVADACAQDESQDLARHSIALGQATRGDFPAARETALTLGYSEPTLTDIAQTIAAQDPAQAVALAADAQEPRARAVILCHAVTRYLALEDQVAARAALDEAAVALDEIDLPDEQVETLCAVGTGYAALGATERSQELLSAAQGIAEDEADDRLLLRVAQAWRETGDTARAIYVAEEIDAFDIGGLWVDIAYTQARAGDFDAARATLATLPPEGLAHAQGLWALGLAYQKNDDRAQSRALWESAAAITLRSRVKTTEDANTRQRILANLTEAFLTLPDAAAARDNPFGSGAGVASDEHVSGHPNLLGFLRSGCGDGAPSTSRPQPSAAPAGGLVPRGSQKESPWASRRPNRSPTDGKSHQGLRVRRESTHHGPRIACWMRLRSSTRYVELGHERFVAPDTGDGGCSGLSARCR